MRTTILVSKRTQSGNSDIHTCMLRMDTNTNASELMTEAELIEFLRIPIVSKAGNHSHVIQHLKRMRGLPCIHISKQPLYPVSAIQAWIQREVEREAGR